MSSSCQVTGEKYCAHDRCWKAWLEELERDMAMDGVTRLIDLILERVKALEDESDLQEIRIYDLERDLNYLQEQIDELEQFKEDKDV